uniref:KilA-N domain-containing protein n=1 Tax=Bacteroides fragilis TaxID=817 RepID=UPI00356A61AB
MEAIKVYKYQETPITFNIGNKNGTMINATEMAKPFGKQPSDWIRLKQTCDIIDSLSTVRGIPRTGLIRIIQGGDNKKNQGTWMHEDVALEFARWLSPAFAIYPYKYNSYKA